jgi:hypothetical protein
MHIMHTYSTHIHRWICLVCKLQALVADQVLAGCMLECGDITTLAVPQFLHHLCQKVVHTSVCVCVCVCVHVSAYLSMCDLMYTRSIVSNFKTKQLKFRLKGGWGLHWYGGDEHVGLTEVIRVSTTQGSCYSDRHTQDMVYRACIACYQ